MPFDPNSVTSLAAELKAKNNIIGRAFFVGNSTVPPFGGSAGSDTSNGGTSELQPFATIAYALTKCVANRGDAIFVLPGHAETSTASIAMSVAGVQVIGISLGNKKPTVTVNGVVNLFSITAANCRLSNLQLTIITTDAAPSLVSVTGAFARVDNLFMIPSTAGGINVVDCIVLGSGGDDALIEDNEIRNTLTAVNSFVSLTAAVARPTFRRNFFFGDCATGGWIDSAAATLVRIEDNTTGTIGATIPAMILDANPTGVLDNNRAFGTSGTIANNLQSGNAIRQARSYVLEETNNSAQATNLIPALDVE